MQFKLKNTFGHEDGKGTAYVIDISSREQIKKYPMKLADGEWICDMELKDGKYIYKFLVDEKLSINDPEASCYQEIEGEVCSVAEICEGQKKDLRPQRLYFGGMEISGIQRVKSIGSNALYINAEKTSFVNAKVTVNGGLGVHSVMLVWTDPTGTIFQTDEVPLYIEDMPYPVSELAVKLYLKDKNRFYPSGKWAAHVYLDGKYEGKSDFYLDMGYGYRSIAVNFTI